MWYIARPIVRKIFPPESKRESGCHYWWKGGLQTTTHPSNIWHMFTYMGRMEVWCRRQRSQRWLNTLVSCRQVGGECKISPESSLRRCRTSDGLICSGRGECECGICICQVTEPGTFYGPRCECHDWVCPTYDGKTCAGKSCLILSQHTCERVSISGAL